MPSETAEKTADPTLPLEDAAAQAAPAPSKGRSVAAHKRQPPAGSPPALPARSEAEAMIDMISAAATNPKVNVDKLDRLLQMRDRIVAREKEQAFFDAMAAAQKEMEPIRADAENKETKSKYASHAALDRVLRPIYTKHGFSLSFDSEPHSAPEMMTVVCFVTARGHTRKYGLELPVDGKGPRGGAVMSRTHAASSGVTYGMRILSKMIWNIAVDRDDDGNAAGKTETDYVDPSVPKVNQQQIDALIELCEAKGCPRPQFLRHIKVEKFEDIPADKFEDHMALINTYERRQK